MKVTLKPTIFLNRYKVMIDQVIVGDAWHYNFGGWSARCNGVGIAAITEEDLIEKIKKHAS